MTPAPTKNPNGPGRVAFVLFAGIAGLSLLRFLVTRVVHLPMAAFQASEGLMGLATFVGVIFYLVWLHRITSQLRASGQQTKYTPGMAVGGWFIPFANFVLPALSLKDVWNRTMGSQNGWLVPLWWASYLLTILFRMAAPLMMRLYTVPGIGYLPVIANLAAYGCWAYILFLQTREQPAGSPVPA